MVIKISRLHTVCVCAAVLAISFFAAVAGGAVSVAKAAGQGDRLPIVMYHKLTTSSRRAGRYTLTSEQFESDLRFLKERGYQTVTVSDLVDYADNGTALPEKPIMITFDDGFEALYAYGVPLLEKYGFTAVAFIIGSVTDFYSQHSDHNLTYSCLDWDAVRGLADGDTVEIQSHSYDLHKNTGKRSGAKKMRGESREDYRKFLTDDIITMQNLMNENAGIVPLGFAYPFGSFSPESKGILAEMGFRAIFLCEERVNRPDRQSTDWLLSLGRYNRPSGISAASFFAKMGIK